MTAMSPSLQSRLDRLYADLGSERAEELLSEALDWVEQDPDEIEEVKKAIAEADAEDAWLSADEIRAAIDETAAEIEVKFRK